MGVRVRAVYVEGQLHLLEPVELREGQQVDVIIQERSEDDAIRAALGDLVQWPNPADDRYADIEAEADVIDQAFSGGRPVSDMILEDRGEV